ncbi:MAG: hypothetical protein PHG21_14285, partial [Azoarcus sp.]|nr:hypothetical protein [Azoarcus sp.]
MLEIRDGEMRSILTVFWIGLLAQFSEFPECQNSGHPEKCCNSNNKERNNQNVIERKLLNVFRP